MPVGGPLRRLGDRHVPSVRRPSVRLPPLRRGPAPALLGKTMFPHCDRGAVVQQPDACQSAPGQVQRHVRFGSSRNRALSAGRPSNRCRRRGSVVVRYRRKACGTGPVGQSDDRCGTPYVVAEVGRSKRAIVWRKSRYLPAISARAGRDRARRRTAAPARNNRSRRGVVLAGLRPGHAMAFMGGGEVAVDLGCSRFGVRAAQERGQRPDAAGRCACIPKWSPCPLRGACIPGS